MLKVSEDKRATTVWSIGELLEERSALVQSNSIESLTAQHQRAIALFQCGEYKGAARLLRELLDEQETSEWWNDWAAAELMCSGPGKSEPGFRRALELDPANHRAAGNLGALLARDGKVAEALPWLEAAAEGGPAEEREQLLRLVQNYRLQLSKSSNGSHGHVLEAMAEAIHQQSVAISALAKRITALEGKSSGQAQAAGAQTAAAIGPNSEHTEWPARKRTTHKPGVYFNAVLYGASGYAEECWNAALALEEAGIPLQIVPVGQQNDNRKLIPEASAKRLKALERESIDLPHSIIYQAVPAHGLELRLHGRTSVARTMFETDSVPPIFRDRCNAMDEVWVPSRFNMGTFASGGVERSKLRLVPGGIDAKTFHPGEEPLKITQKRGFNFLSVFEWWPRKNYWALLGAYLNEFTAQDDVALILKVYQLSSTSADIPSEIAWMIEREHGLPLEKAPTIVVLNGFMTQEAMVRLYATADCFVLPTRGEGYGRPFLEAMACGVPVIATDWGGQSDFLNDSNSYRIPSTLVDVPPDTELSLIAGQRWAEPDPDRLRSLMRHVYEHPEEAQRNAEQARSDVLRDYDWSALMPRWVNEFRRLLT